MNIFEGCTHFVPARVPGAVVCFPLDKCEKCGKTIYNEAESTANIHSITVPGLGELRGMSMESYLAAVMGLKRLSEFPPALVVNFHDDDGLEEEWGCESCM